MIFWIFGAVIGFLLVRLLWKTYMHPASVLGRQAANMNWVYQRRVPDEEGYKNAVVSRGFFEAIISYQNGNVVLTSPPIEKTFTDFIELEKWLAVGERAAETRTAKDVLAFLEVDGALEVDGDLDDSNYHQSLDEATQKVEAFLRKNNIHMPLRGNGESISVAAEQFVYIATYVAILDADLNLSAMGWNSFKRSVENRILAMESDSSPGNASGLDSGVFAHYVSSYWEEMTRMEEKVLKGRSDASELEPLVAYLLGTLGAKHEQQRALLAHLVVTSKYASRHIVPKVIRAFR